ncbi:unnamed protein product [Rotaria sp. Silwood1]|nr:unnamed protein product [Rotaria sp. Silwood1]CAF1483398.1 unnamed protein product [Rotaria sp. Silwood1]CAF3552954.1 unnamed protein product [Rotaria sp. Silwood1]CAF3648965.1 unnamed protein product [Rotaria sp. Silwood1]CAF3681604.1 unnamed protein product [Rotaria sp. Silwood1]
MGEKRKARMTNNEKTSKKEKKSINTVTPTANNDDIEEQSSMHSNSSTTDSNSQQPSITKENTNPNEIEESQTITPIDVENITNDDDDVESKPSTNDNDDNHKIINESNSTTKSWWSSLVRLFHFRNNTNENKPQINGSTNHQSSPYVNGNYLSNIKCRRSLHDESLVN